MSDELDMSALRPGDWFSEYNGVCCVSFRSVPGHDLVIEVQIHSRRVRLLENARCPARIARYAAAWKRLHDFMEANRLVDTTTAEDEG